MKVDLAQPATTLRDAEAALAGVRRRLAVVDRHVGRHSGGADAIRARWALGEAEAAVARAEAEIQRMLAAPGLAPPAAPVRPSSRAAVVAAQGRVVEAVADGTVLDGSAEDLARRLGIGPADLVAALGELAAAGWLAASIGAGGRLTIRWVADARTGDAVPRLAGER